MNLLIRTYISAITIREAAWIDHCMIQRGVKDSLIPFASLNLHRRECLIPQITCIFFYPLKIPVRNILFQIALGTFHADKRYTALQLHLFVFPGRKLCIKAQVLSLCFPGSRYYPSILNIVEIGRIIIGIILSANTLRNRSTPNTVFRQWAIETAIEVNGIIRFTRAISPTSTSGRAFHPSPNRIFVYFFHILFIGCATNSTGQIDLDT